MDYSIVIPAHNAGRTIDRAIAAAKEVSPPPKEIVVYDDASTDSTALKAERHGVKLLRGKGSRPVGPAIARNRAAGEVTSTFIVFVDADVVVEKDAPARLLAALVDPEVAAAFGAYGQEQQTTNIAARYANLRHHWFHATGKREAETFWTGLGAVRREVFLELRGFDRKILTPLMEDVEFGYRLRRTGRRIRLVPEARGAHLKNWTLEGLWRADIFTRALPWSKMIVEKRGHAALNAGFTERLRAILALAVVFFALLSVASPFWLLPSVFAAAGYGYSNRRFFRLLARFGGRDVAVAGPVLHWLYHIYASVTFGTVLLSAQVKEASRGLRRRFVSSRTAGWLTRL